MNKNSDNNNNNDNKLSSSSNVSVNAFTISLHSFRVQMEICRPFVFVCEYSVRAVPFFHRSLYSTYRLSLAYNWQISWNAFKWRLMKKFMFRIFICRWKGVNNGKVSAAESTTTGPNCFSLSPPLSNTHKLTFKVCAQTILWKWWKIGDEMPLLLGNCWRRGKLSDEWVHTRKWKRRRRRRWWRQRERSGREKKRWLLASVFYCFYGDFFVFVVELSCSCAYARTYTRFDSHFIVCALCVYACVRVCAQEWFAVDFIASIIPQVDLYFFNQH